MAKEEPQAKIKIKRLTNNAYIPIKGSANAAGYDLFSAYDEIIPACGKSLIKTDIQLTQIPQGCYGRIAPRSGLAFKHHIDVGAGVIDRDYQGNVQVLLFNLNKEEYKIKKGDRIAQLICEKITYPEIEEVTTELTLTVTERGQHGFGSTGN
uniref:dUTP diphosphatase n=1 Tax=Metapenaeus joyneri majanivirus TaxID=2984280 RepID=A0A9C7BZS3_9VIRU|nr:MAG: dUTPase [Metapenaeus joyneri majanivirus]